MKNFRWTPVQRALIRYRWRMAIIVATLVIAGLIAAVATPYTAPKANTTPFIDTPTQEETYVRAEIVARNDDSGTVRVLDGVQKGSERELYLYSESQRLGTVVLIPEQAPLEGPSSMITVWRMPWLAALLAVMIVLVVAIGGRQGVLSIAGLAISVAVVALYIIPATLSGADALVASAIGAFVIATIAVMIAHTLRWRTVISLASIYIALILVIGLAVLSGWMASLSGIYDDTSGILNASSWTQLDMYGILLGGIIIASLGVLDDVVTTQVATVDELYQTKRSISNRELFTRGMSVGREHLSALVNTLALAYIGVALPTILALSFVIESNSNFLMALNMEYLSVEIIRTAIASIGIILAIPLSTGLAVLLVGKKEQIFAILKRVQYNPRR